MSSEKEINGYWFDHLHSLKRLRRYAEEKGYQDMVKKIDEEINDVNDKLYQKPALPSED